MKHFLQAASRRPPLLYAHYRAEISKADGMERDERILYRNAHTARLRGWAEAAAIDLDALTSKLDVQRRPDYYRCKTWWPTTRAATGGTTGTPLIVHRAFNAVVWEQATIDHIVALQGVDLARAKQAVFRGDNIKAPDDRSPPFWHDVGGRKRIFSSIHLDSQTAPSILAALVVFRPDVIYCYPSTLEIIIAQARKYQVEVRPKLVLSSSEYTPPELFKAVEDTFACPLVDYYGQAERVCFAWADSPGAYRFRHDYGRVELGRADRYGIVVGTSFHNQAQLLYHYDTGDAILGIEALDSPQIAEVELGLAPFHGIAGRVAETMRLPDGRQIVGFNQMPRFVTGVDFVQFLRTGPWQLDVHVVRGAHFTETALAMIERNVRMKVPTEVTTRYVFGDAPLRTPRGKSPIYMEVS